MAAVLLRVVLVLAGFAVMEVAGALAHRWLLHGPWWPLHRSHHLRPSQRVQAGDAVPLVLSALWLLALLAGLAWWWPLLWVSVGALAQLGLHVAVHDLVIHRRFGGPRLPGLRHWADAHEVHHRTNGPPYGVLLVRVPIATEERDRLPLPR